MLRHHVKSLASAVWEVTRPSDPHRGNGQVRSLRNSTTHEITVLLGYAYNVCPPREEKPVASAYGP